MKGREFTTVATWLRDLEGEASMRSQTSRLYYAAYLEARAWCEERLGYSRTRSAREHADVSRLVHGIDAELAASLAFLRDLRNAADYDMHLSPETIALQCLDARRRTTWIIARVDRLAAGTDA